MACDCVVLLACLYDSEVGALKRPVNKFTGNGSSLNLMTSFVQKCKYRRSY